MKRILEFATSNPKVVIAAFLLIAFAGYKAVQTLPVDIFPDISVPRVTIQTEAGGLSADEVEQLVTIPIESAVNGVPGVSNIRASSSGGLSFVWIDFDWNADLSRARFDVFERLARVKETLPEEAHAEITPLVSVTGEIMLVSLTSNDEHVSALEMRELAEYDLRTRLLGIPGIGEVAVIGARLPEFRIALDPEKAAQRGLSLPEIIDAARSTQTYLSAGYIQNIASREVPINQIARAETLDALRRCPVPLPSGGSLRLGEIADINVKGVPRRGSASFNGKEAVVLSIQKAPGGNTPELTKKIEKVLADFACSPEAKSITVSTDSYRQSDFIAKSISGGSEVVGDAAMIVVAVLLVTLLELRTIFIVLCTMPLSILAGIALFPSLGLGINVMTIGGLAVVVGDIVDAAIIFTEVIRRKLAENSALPAESRLPVPRVIVSASTSVAPSVIFSTITVAIVFTPLLMLSGLEGRFFRPLALSYICVFVSSLVCAATIVPALSRLLFANIRAKKTASSCSAPSEPSAPLGVKIMKTLYRPMLSAALKFPKTAILLALSTTAAAVYIATSFGSNFLPPFREDSYNVILSMPPGTSLHETERISEAAVPALKAIDGVLSVTRRTGRAERDQHAEPVSSSEFVIRIDINSDAEKIKQHIREAVSAIPGASIAVSYPIAHRISAVLSGSEAELAVNIYGEDLERLRKTANKIKQRLDGIGQVTDVRANREITVQTLRITYDLDALAESGITLEEAGEQVSAAFNGLTVGEVRNGIRKRMITVRLAGDESKYSKSTVESLLLSSKSGKRVRLSEIANVNEVESSNLLLRESSRRKILVTCNLTDGANLGDVVELLRRELAPLAAADGASIEFGGSYMAKESAAKSLGIAGVALSVILFLLLVFALRSTKAAFITLFNIPLGLIGSVAAVAISGGVLSVSSLIGLVTVAGFLLRNGILLLNCYRERIEKGVPPEEAIRGGSEERMVPIILTSATTAIGLVPIVLSAAKPGGELLSPLAVVQFGGLLSATVLSLIILPAAAKAFGTGYSKEV